MTFNAHNKFSSCFSSTSLMLLAVCVAFCVYLYIVFFSALLFSAMVPIA